VGPIVHVVRFSPGQLIQILKQKSKIESNLEKKPKKFETRNQNRNVESQNKNKSNLKKGIKILK
jgi:hypothetical protein